MSHRPQFLIAGLAVSGLFAISTGAAFGQQGVGVNSAIRNQVQMKTARDSALRPAVIREQVHIGDSLATGAASQLQVLLLDKSVFTVGPNARMTIDKFVYNPDQKAGEVAASVARGAFRFASGGPAAAGGRKVTTPAGSIGIRGTIVEGAVGPDANAVMGADGGAPGCSGDPAGAMLAVLRGPGARTGGLDKPGAIDVTAGSKTTSLTRAGQAVLACNGEASAPFMLSDAALGRLSELLRPGGGGGDGSEIGPVGRASGSIGDVVETTRFLAEPLDVELPLINGERQGPKPPSDCRITCLKK